MIVPLRYWTETTLRVVPTGPRDVLDHGSGTSASDPAQGAGVPRACHENRADAALRTCDDGHDGIIPMAHSLGIIVAQHRWVRVSTAVLLVGLTVAVMMGLLSFSVTAAL